MNQNNLLLDKQQQLIPLEEIHLTAFNMSILTQFIEEYKHIEVLQLHKLPVDNKVLLYGASGCGKTLTANAIAHELKREILTLDLGGFVSSRLGETGKNILNVFHRANRGKKVLFIDEFDFLGTSRSYDKNDSASGEMKRLVNTVIQQIDQLSPNCMLIAATNHFDAIDSALTRRFQLRIKYESPKKPELDNFYDKRLDTYPSKYRLIERLYDVSYAEAKDQINREVKNAIIREEIIRIKSKKQYLFSYGTLQLEKVQIAIYGRTLKGNACRLALYALTEAELVEDQTSSKRKRENEKVAVYTGLAQNHVEGMIYEITDEELTKTDQSEMGDTKRVLQIFDSGQTAWVYVKK